MSHKRVDNREDESVLLLLLWCAVALWLVHATDDRVVAGSNQGSAMIALFVECNLGFLLMNTP